MSSEFFIPSTFVQTYGDGSKEIYIKQEELGHGGFAKVYRVTNQRTGKDYAMKVISKERYEGEKGQKLFEKLKNEILIQKVVNHPNIVKSYGSFCDEFNYYIILEYCPGKSVKEMLRNSPNGYLSESQTKKILKDVICGLVYLHNKHIIHRDLKLENYMIGSDGKVKIADFGISVILKNDDEKRFSICGTTNYLSPELLQKVNKGHSYEVDIWAIGVSTFSMLTGHPPFEGGRKSITYENIKNCDYHFPPDIKISSDAKDFIRTILKINPETRPTAIDLYRHKFLTSNDRDPIEFKDNNNLFIRKEFVLLSNITTTTTTTSTSSITHRNFSSNVPGPLRPRIPLPPKDCKLQMKNVNVPKSAVSRYLLNGNDLGYLLADGTVGACFTDHSRIVMDPNENFVQFYNNYSSSGEIIDLDDHFRKNKKVDKLSDKIELVRKFAKNLKKFESFYDLPTDEYDSSETLHYIKYFLVKNDAIIFKFNDKNVQVDFNDHKKLFILWNSKQMCLVRNIKDKCNFLSFHDVTNMDSQSDEYKKFMITKELMAEL